MQNQVIVLGFGLATAAVSAILLAADGVVESFWTGAERWGLWAALTLLLVLACLWGLYRIVTFVLDTLVGLVEDNQRCMTKVGDAIRSAPCGVDWDSDDNDNEKQEDDRKAMERINRRMKRRERAAEGPT